MTLENAERFLKKAGKLLQEVEFRCEETSKMNYRLVATTKTLTITGDKLKLLGNYLGEINANITFGRSGANFRMIIQD